MRPPGQDGGLGSVGSRTTALRVVALLGLAVLLGGCGFGPPRSNPFDATGQRQILIEVENRHLQTVTLHAASLQGRPRLGTIAGNSSGNFSMGWSAPRELRIEIMPAGESSFTTRGILVHPGDRLRLRIEPTLSRSTLR